MRCFTHPQVDAVAQCSQCQKGICSACAHSTGDATFCSSCFETGLREEIAHAQRNVVGVWIFTGALTVIAAIAAIASIAQGGAGADFGHSTGICCFLVSLFGLVSSMERI